MKHTPDSSQGVLLSVKIVAGSSRTELCGMYNGMLKIKVAAVAEKGKANECLTDFLSEQLGIRKNAISIVSGQTSPIKQIKIDGVSSNHITQVLSPKTVKKGAK